MKKYFFTILLALATQFAVADDYTYLNVTRTSGESSLTLSTVKKITFTSTNIVITTTNGDVTYPLSEMQKMQFSNTAVSVESLPQKTKDLRYKGGTLYTSQKGLLRVYNASGALVSVASIDQEGAKVNLASLPRGLYIVSLGQQTIKITK